MLFVLSCGLHVVAVGAALSEKSLWRTDVHSTKAYTPPEGGKIETPFVIISHARSATNSLATVLDANPRIQCFYEAFSNRSVYALDWEKWTVQERDADRSAFMERLFTRRNPTKPKTRAQGFKIFPWQLSNEEYLALVRAKHVKKIVIERQDVVAQYVSRELGLMSDYWSPVDKAKEKVTTISFDMKRFEWFKNSTRLWFDYAWQQAKEFPSSWLFLTSEEVTTDKYAIMKVYDHLRIPEGHAMPYQPYNAKSLESKITNYAEIWEALDLPPPKRHHVS